MSLLKSYFKPGEDVNILNTQYVRGSKQEDGTWSDDYFYIVYRDNSTGEKKLKTIVNPSTTIFFTKEEHRNEFKTQRLYLPIKKVQSTNVQYRKIKNRIAREIKEDGRDTPLLEVARSEPREVFKWRHSYFADYDINDYALITHALYNVDHLSSTMVTTSFLDIESDIYGLTNTEVNEGAAPINAVSVVMAYDENGKELKHPVVFTLLLRNYEKYEEQEYFENHIDEFLEECHSEFDKKYNSPKFRIHLYDDEVVLLKNLFALLHKMRPDFILIWNMSYDIPTMIQRLKYLGENPANYFCHPDFVEPNYRYNFDLVYKNDFKNKSESFECTCYSQWVDQMLNYAGIRKSAREYGGNSLDNIAKIVLGAEKRRFDSARTNVTNAAIREYWNFVKYSINDVLLQYGIEKRTGDINTLFDQAINGGTRVHKALKQSVYLKNVWAIEYFKLGIVPRNNKNFDNSSKNSDDDDPDAIALAGAVVGDPIYNVHNGIRIRAKDLKLKYPEKASESKSNHLFQYVGDEDFAAMYPNIKRSANISEATQIGRLIIDEQVLENENPLNEPKFMRATKFIEDYETRDPNILGAWLHLPNITTMAKKYKEMYHKDDIKQIITYSPEGLEMIGNRYLIKRRVGVNFDG